MSVRAYGGCGVGARIRGGARLRSAAPRAGARLRACTRRQSVILATSGFGNVPAVGCTRTSPPSVGRTQATREREVGQPPGAGARTQSPAHRRSAPAVRLSRRRSASDWLHAHEPAFADVCAFEDVRRASAPSPPHGAERAFSRPHERERALLGMFARRAGGVVEQLLMRLQIELRRVFFHGGGAVAREPASRR